MTELALAPVAPVRAVLLILRLRLRALLNQLAGLVVTGRKKPRVGAPRRGVVRAQGSAVFVGVALLLLWLAWTMAFVTLKAMRDYALWSGAVSRALASQAISTRPYVEGLSFFVDWAMLAVLCLALGYRDPRALGARIEALLALPVSVPLAFIAEIAERAVINPLLWVTVFPLLTCAAREWGHGWWSPVVAAPLTLWHGTTVAALEFGIAVFARQRLPPGRAATFRAAVLAFGMLSPIAFQAFLMDFAHFYEGRQGFTLALLRAVAPISLLTPGGAGLLLLQGAGRAFLDAGTWSPVLLSILVWLGALLLLARVSSRGLDAVTPSAGTRGEGARPSPVLRWFSGAMAEELIALARDKVALTMNVLVPAATLVAGAWLGSRELASTERLTVMAVVLGGLVAGPAALALPRMGDAVWLLYTVARPLERIVLERAAVWAGAGVLAGLAALGLVTLRAGSFGMETLTAVGMILFGIPTMALGSAALGILGADPQAAEAHRRLRPEESIYQLFLLVGLGAAAGAPGGRERLLIFVMLAGIAAALWQRALRHLPFVLDPSAREVRPLDAADGLKALLAFFALQTLLHLAFQELSWSPAVRVSVGFLIAGLFAIGLTVDPLVQQGLPLRNIVPLWSGAGSLARISAGAILGSVGYFLALSYKTLLEHQLGHPIPQTWTPRLLLEMIRHPVVRIVGPVVLAPLIEEVIFRGLLFRGIRTSLGLRPAVLLSALAFALVHPAHGFGAVFALGALSAWIYERTGLLSAAIAAHAVYNGALVLSR